MTEFKVIIPGYAYMKGQDYYASPTTTAIYDSGKLILVDPGTSPLLLEKLKESNIEIDDIDFIYLTHYHPDHFLNLKYFPNTKMIDGTTIWDGDKESTYEEFIPKTKIQVIATPGHSPEHSSLLLDIKKFGKVCIAQDVFWWEDGLQDTSDYDSMINYPDPFASDMEALVESRKKVLKMADYIIPGHGDPFASDFMNAEAKE